MAGVIIISVIVVLLLYKVERNIANEKKELKKLEERLDMQFNNRMRKIHNRLVNIKKDKDYADNRKYT